MKRYIFGFFLLAGLLVSAPALAAIATPEGATGVRINWGEPVAWALSGIGGILSAVWAAAQGLLPGPARWAISVSQIDQVILRSIQAWANNRADEIREKGWTGDLRNQAVRDVSVLALNTGNKYVKQVRDSLAAKVAARLEEYITKTAAG